MKCNACPRKCNVDRSEKLGFCREKDVLRGARASLHFWEEPVISGKLGSGTVFFSGCNLKCVFCQNYEISAENKGIEISFENLKRIFNDLIEQGANNINLVNPTHFSDLLCEFLSKNQFPVPIVYNSSGYESVETLKKFEGLIDIYLPDFKYIRNDKAKRYSKAEDYPQVVKNALKEMRRQQKEDVIEDGLMKKGMIIRHLVLPSNTNSTLEILDYLKENYENSYISLMSQYVPCGDLSEHSEINRKLTKREYEKVVCYATDLGFKNVYVQELNSAEKNFIPAFDFSGIL